MRISRIVVLQAIVVMMVLLTGSPGYAQSGHVMLTMDDVKWTEGPAALPKGAQLFMMEGNPPDAAPFTMRLKFPANYKVGPHWHPAIEHATVLKGTLNLGMGEKFDASQTKALPVGSFVVIPPKTAHFAWTSEETIVQLHGVGPWSVNYVNQADDPRRK